MPDSNLSTSIAAIRSKILTDAPSATIDDILSLARAAKSIGLTEDTTIETALNSRIQTLSSGATTAEMAKLSNAIKQVRDISGGVGSTTTDDIVEGSTNKYLNKTALTTQLSDLGGHILPDTTEIYDLGSTTNKFRDLYLSGNTLNIGDQTISADATTISMNTIKLGSGNNTVTLEVDSSGDFQRTSVKNGVTQPTSPIVGSSNDLSDVDLTVQPEVLELQVADPTAGRGTAWQWTWEQSSLPYARATITNQTQPSVALYMQGTYTLNNFANTAYGAMTQRHDFKLKWIEGSGDQNLVSWATYSTIDDTHPDINGGTTTSVQRLAINVPTTITPPSLTAPTVSYNVSNGVGAYAFTGAANGNNPSIGPFYRGGTYTIDISATGHPFYFTTDNGTNFAAGTYFGEYTTGVTGSRNETGTISFTVPNGAPDTLYYQCGNHAGMRGSIAVKDLVVETNANGNYIIYGQHDNEGHSQPMELRPIPSLVNQMCLVYDGTNNKWVPQDMATYVENTPAFENKIKEVAGTATLVAADGTSLVASVNIYSDATYLPAAGNTVGDIAFAEDTQKLYIYKSTTIGWIETVAATDLTGYATESYVNTYVADNAGGSNTLEYTSTQSASPHDVMMLNSDGTVTPVSPTSYSAVFNDSNKYAFGNQSGGQGNFGGTGRVALNPTNRTESVLFSDTPNGTDMHGYVITSGAISGSINSFDSVSITPASYLGHWYDPYDATKLYIFMTFGSQYDVRVIECSVAVSGLTWVSTTDTGARTQNWNSSLQYNHAESADGDVRWILSTANTNECKAQQIKYDGSSWTTIDGGGGSSGATLDTSSNGVTSTKYDGELSIAWSKTVSGLFVKANGLVLQSGKIDWTTGNVTLASPQAIYWSSSAYGTTAQTSHYPALDISENNRVAVIYKNDTSWALVKFAVMDLNTSTYGLSQNGYGQTLVSAPNGNSGMPLDVCFPIGSNYGAISYAQSDANDSNINTAKAMVNLNGSGATYAITDTYYQYQDDAFLSIAKFQTCPIQKGHMSLFTKRMTQVNSGWNSYYYGDPEIHYYVLPYADSNLDKTKIIGMSNSTGTTVDVTPEHALHVGLSGLSANSTYYVLEDGSYSTVADTNDAKLGTALNSTTISLDFTEAVVASNLATYATKTYVDNQITSLVDSSPDALNTLNELAAAMGDDASFSTTITNSIATKLSTTDFTTTANAWAGTIGTHLLPDTNITYDLGSATHRFRDLYLDGNTIDLGGQTIKATATGIEVPEIKIGTGTNSVKLTAGADGKLTTTETDASGNTGAATSAGGGSSTTIVATMTDLNALTGMATGDFALVTATNKAYMYSGTSWFLMATLSNESPAAITGGNATYALATDGTPTVITLASTDPEEQTLTWSYTVTSGSLSPNATISQNGNVFTITPSTPIAGPNGFTLNFEVTDGVSSPASTSSAFTVTFIATYSTLNTTLIHPLVSGGVGSGGSSSTMSWGQSLMADTTHTVVAVTKGLYLYTNTNGIPATTHTYQTIFSGNRNTGIIGLTPDYYFGYELTSGNDHILVYNKSNGNLARTINDPGPNGYNNDFGKAGVAVIDDTNVIVGSSKLTVSGTAYAGCVYSINFDTGATNWTSNLPESARTAQSMPCWGSSIASDGTHVAVGTKYAANNTVVDQDGHYMNSTTALRIGQVDILDASNGSFLQTLTNPKTTGTYATDGFGHHIRMNDTYMIVSSPGLDDSDGTQSGAVYVYTKSGSTWSLARTISNPNDVTTAYSVSENFGSFSYVNTNTPSSDDDFFGLRMEIESGTGSIAAIWANDKENGPPGTFSNGTIYLYDVSDGTKLGKVTNIRSEWQNYMGDGWGLGYGHNDAMSLSSGKLIIGAGGDDNTGSSWYGGKIYAYQ